MNRTVNDGAYHPVITAAAEMRRLASALRHFTVGHWSIASWISHIVGFVRSCVITAAGKGQDGDDQAKGGQGVLDCDFHDNCNLWLILDAIEF